METLSWGILGTGNIARVFAESAPAWKLGRLAAVASRSAEAAGRFAADFGIKNAHGDYSRLLADPSVEAVYIALPNLLHHQWTLAALAAGKHVLCEKPIALDAPQAREMFAAARSARRLLAEAFMYRCHPQTAAILDTIRSGAIGTPKLVRTSFCFRTRKPEGNIRFSRELGGGALMDVGCYCINFSRMVFGQEPVKCHASARMTPLGVDELSAGTLNFPAGVAEFSCGTLLHADNAALVCGDEGYLVVPVPWKPGTSAQFRIEQNAPARADTGKFSTPPQAGVKTIACETPLYALEADAFARAVRGDAPPAVSMEDTIGNMVALDALRASIGLSFAPTPEK